MKNWSKLLLVLGLLLLIVGVGMIAQEPAIDTKGSAATDYLPYVTLASGFVTLMTGIVGLWKAILEARAKREKA